MNAKILRILQKEFPDNPDLKDIISSVSPYMSARSRAIQARYFQLLKQAGDK